MTDQEFGEKLVSHRIALSKFANKLKALEVEELVQETMYRGWEYRNSLKNEDRMLQWLFGIMYFAHTRIYRKQKRIAPVNIDLIAYSIPALYSYNEAPANILRSQRIKWYYKIISQTINQNKYNKLVFFLNENRGRKLTHTEILAKARIIKYLQKRFNTYEKGKRNDYVKQKENGAGEG